MVAAQLSPDTHRKRRKQVPLSISSPAWTKHSRRDRRCTRRQSRSGSGVPGPSRAQKHPHSGSGLDATDGLLLDSLAIFFRQLTSYTQSARKIATGLFRGFRCSRPQHASPSSPVSTQLPGEEGQKEEGPALPSSASSSRRISDAMSMSTLFLRRRRQVRAMQAEAFRFCSRGRPNHKVGNLVHSFRTRIFSKQHPVASNF